MPSLDGRLARAYGWEWSPNNPEDFERWGKPWVVKRFTDGSAIHRPTPDPENEWQDFGAMLEFAGVDVAGCQIMQVLGPWSFEGNDKRDWRIFRRAVTERILRLLP